MSDIRGQRKAVTIRSKGTFIGRRAETDTITMGVIEDAYENLEADVSLEDFRSAVEAKVDEMAGLADAETAALLVAHELDENRVRSIGNLTPELAEAKFLAKVRKVGEHRTFQRDDGEEGHVVNVEAMDETGSVRLAFWDDHAKAIQEEGLEPGTVLRVKGRPKDGMHGLEVSVEQAEPAPDAEIDVEIDGVQPIESLTVGQSGVTLQGRVLDCEPVRTFERDDGETGRVSNLLLGDETGRIRVTLWDDRAEVVEELSPDDVIELTDGSVRERDEKPEVHIGSRGDISVIDADIQFHPTTSSIATLEPGDVVDVAGVIRSTDAKRTFERDDGSDGQVRNVRLQDETGDVRVALWGEAADRELAPGDTIWLGDVEVRDGWQDDIELSVGWQTSMAKVDLATVTVTAATPATAEEAEEESPSLSSFKDESGSEQKDGEAVTFQGTVVQTGTPLILDDGDEAVSVETDADVILGQEITVHGTQYEDRIVAEEVRPTNDNA